MGAPASANGAATSSTTMDQTSTSSSGGVASFFGRALGSGAMVLDVRLHAIDAAASANATNATTTRACP
jgi:hypothetical protein